MNPKDLESKDALEGLAFKAEDADLAISVPREGKPVTSGFLSIERANQLLCERLEKAQIVYGFKGVQYTVWHPHPVGGDHSIARLVCIEELKK